MTATLTPAEIQQCLLAEVLHPYLFGNWLRESGRDADEEGGLIQYWILYYLDQRTGTEWGIHLNYPDTHRMTIYAGIRLWPLPMWARTFCEAEYVYRRDYGKPSVPLASARELWTALFDDPDPIRRQDIKVVTRHYEDLPDWLDREPAYAVGTGDR